MRLCSPGSYLEIMADFVAVLRVLEMQAILIALIENFEISPPPNDLNVEILRGSAPTLIPLVKGQEKTGAQMPLKIAAIA